MCIPAEGGGLGVGSGVVRVGFQYRVGLRMQTQHNTAQNNTKQHNTHTSHVRM